MLQRIKLLTHNIKHNIKKKERKNGMHLKSNQIKSKMVSQGKKNTIIEKQSHIIKGQSKLIHPIAMGFSVRQNQSLNRSCTELELVFYE